MSTPNPFSALPSQDRWSEILGLELLEVTPERVRARVEIGPQHHQPFGIAHGGVYASIVEAATSYGAGARANADGWVGVVGVSNTTHFFRSTASGELIAEATPLHTGKSGQLWEVAIHRSSDGKLVSHGQVRFQRLTELPSERKSLPKA